MDLSPGYGETPVAPDDLDALTALARDLLGDDPTNATLYDLEQAVLSDVSERELNAVIEGDLTLDDLLTDRYLRSLHAALYGDIWTWAGRFRTRELNIGVAPTQLSTQLRESLDTIRYRWTHTSDWNARQLGIVVHAETVRIHPFIDGNGRTTRLLADLTFLATQEAEPLQTYDWRIDKTQYIALLREYDQERDITALAAFVPTTALS